MGAGLRISWHGMKTLLAMERWQALAQRSPGWPGLASLPINCELDGDCPLFQGGGRYTGPPNRRTIQLQFCGWWGPPGALGSALGKFFAEVVVPAVSERKFRVKQNKTKPALA